MLSRFRPAAIFLRRISTDDLQAALANGWIIESIEQTSFETDRNFKRMDFRLSGLIESCI
jgi:hypothetical protein